MEWMILFAIAGGILILLTVIGLVKNIVRLGIALIAGFIAAAAVFYGAQALGVGGIPQPVYIITGGIAAFLAFARMRR